MENSYSHVLDRPHSSYFISLYIFQNYLAESKIQVEGGRLQSHQQVVHAVAHHGRRWAADEEGGPALPDQHLPGPAMGEKCCLAVPPVKSLKQHLVSVREGVEVPSREIFVKNEQ